MSEVKQGKTPANPDNQVGKNPGLIKEGTSDPAAQVQKKDEEKPDTLLTFKDNRKYDLHIGRKVLTFTARETKKVHSSLLDHPDWDQAKKLFVIRPIEEEK